MAGNPRIVTEDVVFQWDGVSQRLPRGQVMDVPPGSALERAIGKGRLRPLGAVAAQPPAQAEEEPKAEEPGTALAKARSTAKKQDNDKDGGS